MALYEVGDGAGADFADYDEAETAIDASGDPLPETGGTIFETTGTITDTGNAHTFSNSNYSNGLTLRAKAGEEADGATGGALVDNVLTISVQNIIIEKLNIRSLTIGFDLVAATVDDCDFGINSDTSDVLNLSSAQNTAFTNCIVRGQGSDGIRTGASPTGMTFDLITQVGASAFGFIRAETLTDCLSINTGTEDFFDGAGTVGDFLASEDATAATVATTTSFTSRTTSDLENFGTGNFNLASGSSLNTAGSGGGRIGALLAAAAAAGNPWYYYAQQ